MAAKRDPKSEFERKKLLSELRSDVMKKRSGYRAKALGMFPHICASCGREFEGRRMKELTVHHKDHDHEHNPPDGSNWELLCIYCHDHEHEKRIDAKHRDGGPGGPEKQEGSGLGNPFSALDGLLGG